MDNAEEQVKDLLCDNSNDQRWMWGRNQAIYFYKDGTGTIECGVELHSEATLDFNWLFIAAPVKDNSAWKLAIQITLSTGLHSVYHYDDNSLGIKGAALQETIQNPPPPSKAPFPWAPLLSPAFRPKQYNVTLSSGRFIEPFQLATKEPYPLFKKYRQVPRRYRRQLVFDVSPFPPREEWIKSKHHGLDSMRFWDMKVFVADYIDKKDETWGEMLDWSYWLSPTAGGWR